MLNSLNNSTISLLLLALTPILAMFSGLSVAVTVSALLVVLVMNTWSAKSEIRILKINDVWGLCGLLLLWILISITFTSYNLHLATFVSYLQLSVPILLLFMLSNKHAYINCDHEKVIIALSFGVAAAVLVFCVEYYTNGFIVDGFRKLFQQGVGKDFKLHLLDRGCAFLSVTLWILIGYYSLNKRYLISVIIYGVGFCLFLISDSLASFLAFCVAGIIHILLLISNLWSWLIRIGIIVSSIVMPIFAYTIDYKAIIYNSSFLPASAKHRIFIWNFVAHKVPSSPILGYGFGASKNMPIAEDQILLYQNHIFCPLPLHPHNNILQILFETGIIGLALFTLIGYKILLSIGSYKNNIVRASLYSAFVNYYVIGMISFSVWQAWWVLTAIWIVMLAKILYIKND